MCQKWSWSVVVYLLVGLTHGPCQSAVGAEREDGDEETGEACAEWSWPGVSAAEIGVLLGVEMDAQ
jgi:hypothetical protein